MNSKAKSGSLITKLFPFIEEFPIRVKYSENEVYYLAFCDSSIHIFNNELLEQESPEFWEEHKNFPESTVELFT